MIFTSKNPIQNEKSSAKSLPLSIEILGILPKILLPIRAENEDPSIQTKIAAIPIFGHRYLPVLLGHGVLLYQRLIRHVELQWVVCGQRHAHPARMEFLERVVHVRDKQGVVGQRTDGQRDL